MIDVQGDIDAYGLTQVFDARVRYGMGTDAVLRCVAVASGEAKLAFVPVPTYDAALPLDIDDDASTVTVALDDDATLLSSPSCDSLPGEAPVAAVAGPPGVAPSLVLNGPLLAAKADELD